MTTQFSIPQKEAYLKESLRLSPHSEIRSQQRGLSIHDLNDVLDYGEIFHRQGMLFYIAGKRFLPENFPHERAEKINNMVVVVSGETGEIVTSYKNRNAFRRIQKKSKILF